MKSINHNAAVKFTMAIDINATQVKVWSVLTDIDKWPSWQTDIKYASLNGPLEADTTFDWKSGGVKIHSRLHTVNPYRQFGWTGKTIGISAIHNWTINAKADNVSITVEESMEGFLVNLFKKSFNRALEDGLKQWLEYLKKECEGVEI